MDKQKFKSIINEEASKPQIIEGISYWCDRWCERCKGTESCTIYNVSSHFSPDKQDDFYNSVYELFESTIDLLEKHSEEMGIDFHAQTETEFEDDYNRRKDSIKNNAGLLLAKKYEKQVKDWLNCLRKKEPYGMEIRLHDSRLADSLEVIQWYQSLFGVKMERALMSQKEEETGDYDIPDSIGNAKLLLVSIERNINAWAYLYEKFREDEDDILKILSGLQRLYHQIEQTFPNAKSFIRNGLDE